MATSASMENINQRELKEQYAWILENESYDPILNEQAKGVTALMFDNLKEKSAEDAQGLFKRDEDYLKEAKVMILSEKAGTNMATARTAISEGTENALLGKEVSEDAPVTSGGLGIGLGGISGDNTGTIAGYDPVMMPVLRRAMPRMLSYEVCGVQGMKQNSQLIFALKAKATNAKGEEILFHEGDTRLGGDNNTYGGTYEARGGKGKDVPTGTTKAEGGQTGDTNTVARGNDDDLGTAQATFTDGDIDTLIYDGVATTGTLADGTDVSTLTTTEARMAQKGKLLNAGLITMGFDTANMERTGRGGAGDPAFQKITFSIERTSVIAKGRQLESEYSIELAQDLKAVHGMDAEKELAGILANELLFEVNREIVRTIYMTAVHGARVNVRQEGVFNLDTDGRSRWLNESFQSLFYQIQRDANAIGQRTRRDKANILICSADVASALDCLGRLTHTPNLDPNLPVNDTQRTYVGMLGTIKVFADPYTSNSADTHFYLLGYRGAKAHDAGLYYCPYIPIQMVRAVNHNSYNNRLAMKSRYGIVANPFVVIDSLQPDGEIAESPRPKADENYYYSRTFVTNLS